MDLEKFLPYLSQNMLGLAFVLTAVGTLIGKLGGQLLGHHKDLLAANEDLRRQAIVDLKESNVRVHDIQLDLDAALQSLRQANRKLNDALDEVGSLTRELAQLRLRP